ncbi:MAG: iron chelate uptake ABC transporter family permease subunit [Actinomycetaceae bacterium]|nr:iron chelate uptake ABC transporter family permease subunit [Actinomycetaceae bacterium]
MRSSSSHTSPKRTSRLGLGLLVLLGALVLSFTFSIFFGSNMGSPAQTWEAIIHPSNSETSVIVWSLRMPRTILGIVVGVAYGVAGALIQAITRNPLADTGILGVNAGAGFAVTIGVGIFGVAGNNSMMLWAMGGALLATGAVYIIGGMGESGASPATLVLAGVALGALLGGVSSALVLLDPDTFERIRRWGLGTIVTVNYHDVLQLGPYIVVALGIAAAIAHSLNAAALGDDLAITLGARLIRTRILGIIAVTILAGSATAITGGLSFVGLMIPHIVRWFTGPDQRWILAYSALAAPSLVLSSDVIGRLIAWPGEIEVGIITAALGAPLLIALVRRRKVSTL